MAFNPKTITLHGKSFTRMIDGPTLRERVSAMAAKVSERLADKDVLLLSVLKGSFVFAADFYRAWPLLSPIDFIGASSYTGMQSTGSVAFTGLDTLEVRDRHIVILEDIVDSGTTLSRLIPLLREKGAADIEICTLLLKPEELIHDLPLLTVGFEIEPVFVVGYGLDYDELGRNLDGIYKTDCGPSQST